MCSTPFQYRQFLLQIEDGSTILDIGCGNGIIILFVSKFRVLFGKIRQLQTDKAEEPKNLRYRHRRPIRLGQ